jgi:hypothetical protein
VDDLRREYVTTSIGPEAVQEFLNEMGKQGYMLVNIQPLTKKIDVREVDTVETTVTFIVTVERAIE